MAKLIIIKESSRIKFDKFWLFSLELIFYEKIFLSFNACMYVTVGLSNHKWSFSVFRRNIFCGFSPPSFFSETNFCGFFFNKILYFCYYEMIVFCNAFLQCYNNSDCKIKMSKKSNKTNQKSRVSVKILDYRKKGWKRSFTIWLIISWFWCGEW